MSGYRKDWRFETDNNLVENAIRLTAISRRGCLFIGHAEAAWRSEVICSVILSCLRRSINPQSYLTYVLAQLS